MNKALVMLEHNEPLVVQQRKIPRAPAKGLVLKVKAAGLCHSDVHIWENLFEVEEGKNTTMEELESNYHLPIVLCHEIAGEVSEVGSQSGDEVKVGDRVVLYSWIGCGECSYCKTGYDNFCTKSQANSYGICRDGGFQEYIEVRDSNRVVKLPASIAMDTGCLIGCSALTAFHALTRLRPTVERRVQIHGSANVVIVGTGGLGIWAQKLSRAVLPKGTKVFQADISEDKLELAKKCGADGTILWSRSDTTEEIVAKTKAVVGDEIDGGIDFVGHCSTTERLYEATRNGNTVVTVGLGGGVLKISTTKSLFKNINMAFVYVGSLHLLRELVETVDKHMISPPPISHHNLEEVNGLMKLLQEGKIPGRAVVMFK